MIHDNAYCGICNLFFSWKMKGRLGIGQGLLDSVESMLGLFCFVFLTIAVGVDSEHCGSHIMFYVFYRVSKN